MFRAASGLIIAGFVGLPTSADAFEWARYMEKVRCTVLKSDDPLVADFPFIRDYTEAGRANGIDVRSCDYPFEGGEPVATQQFGWVVLAHPSGKLLDQWIATACAKGAPRIANCAEQLSRFVNGQSGGQFPVAGFVSEGPPHCKQHDTSTSFTGLIAFEHGVTVQRAANPTIEHGLPSRAP